MGYTSKNDIIIAHAVLGGLLAMVFWPLAAVIGRYLRNVHPKWNRMHYIVSGVISAPVLIVVFALGRAHKIGDPDNWTTFHFRNGLALLLLGLLQAIYGTILHRFTSRFPVTGPKAMLRYLHPITGIVILALGFAQVYTGFGQWGKPGKVPHGAIVAWGVLLAFWTIVYLAGFVLLPKQWEQRKAELGEEKQQEVYDVGVGEGRRSSVAPFNRASVDA